jgi:hypothetical protein
VLLVVARLAQTTSDGPLVTTDEWVQPLEVWLPAPLREQPVSQPEEPPPAMRREQPLQAALEQQQAQLLAHLLLEQPREPQVLQPVEQ